MARRLKVCHDRILPQNLNRPQVIESGRRGAPARAVFEFRKMWINGSNLRVRFIGGSASQRAPGEGTSALVDGACQSDL